MPDIDPAAAARIDRTLQRIASGLSSGPALMPFAAARTLHQQLLDTREAEHIHRDGARQFVMHGIAVASEGLPYADLMNWHSAGRAALNGGAA